SGDGGENHDVYLRLPVTVLAAFCRVPEIASSVEMVSWIPLILEIMSKGSHAMEVAIKILQLLVSKLSSESMNIERFFELSLVVAAVARQFAVLHNALKFEELHLLSAVFCSDYSVSFHSFNLS
ncbi:hypothetical protein HID58_079226, partial [Brassica napus]